jgi:hypothetical protein
MGALCRLPSAGMACASVFWLHPPVCECKPLILICPPVSAVTRLAQVAGLRFPKAGPSRGGAEKTDQPSRRVTAACIKPRNHGSGNPQLVVCISFQWDGLDTERAPQGDARQDGEPLVVETAGTEPGHWRAWPVLIMQSQKHAGSHGRGARCQGILGMFWLVLV